jgi:hypothetical protein
MFLSDFNGLPMLRIDFAIFTLFWDLETNSSGFWKSHFFVFTRKPFLRYICYTSLATQPVVTRREMWKKALVAVAHSQKYLIDVASYGL